MATQNQNMEMDTGSSVVHVKSEDVYGDLTADIAKRFDTSNYEVERLPSIRKNTKAIRLMRDALGGRIMKEFVALSCMQLSRRWWLC